MPVASDRPTTMLAFQDVGFSYGLTPAVEHVTFAVERGDFVALIGPNGSGKSTLIKLALGLERPQTGRVLLLGQEIRSFREWHRIGYVPQFVGAFAVRFPATVGEVVSHGRYRGMDPLAIVRRRLSPATEQALHQAGVWELRNRLVSELSGGQQRRVLIARALVSQPELLILDEPTSGLDRVGQEQFYDLLRHLHRDLGVTLVLVSHDLGMVLHEATKVACLNVRLLSYLLSQEVTETHLSSLYGSAMDLVIHQHE